MGCWDLQAHVHNLCLQTSAALVLNYHPVVDIAISIIFATHYGEQGMDKTLGAFKLEYQCFYQTTWNDWKYRCNVNHMKFIGDTHNTDAIQQKNRESL